MAASTPKAFDIHPTSKPLSVPNLPVEETKSTKAVSAKKTAAEEETTSIPVKINQSKGLITEEPKAEDTTEESVATGVTPKEATVHHEKKIEPLAEQKEEPVPESTEPEAAESASTETPSVEEIKVEEEKPTVPQETVDAPHGEPAYTRDEEVPVKPLGHTAEEIQEPKLFDTTQYHLPIKTTKSHNSGKHMTGFFIVFILVVVIGGVLAIDAGWLDLGITLPFDFIQN